MIILGCGFDPSNPPKIIPKWGPNFGSPGLFFDFGRPCRPRWPQWRQKCPKASPRGLKIGPRRPQGGQKCHQGCQNDPQSVPQMAPMRSKVPPEGPERSKGSKKCQQDAPSSPKDQKHVTKNGQEAEQDQGCDPPRNTWPKDLKMRFPPLCTNEF